MKKILDEKDFKLLYMIFLTHKHTKDGRVILQTKDKLFEGDLLEKLKKEYGINYTKEE